jgi:hypothetical protein
VVPGPFTAVPRRSFQFAEAGSAAALSQQEKNNRQMCSGAVLSLAVMYLADIFAAGPPPPTHV